jgi:hypothetical protein
LISNRRKTAPIQSVGARPGAERAAKAEHVGACFYQRRNMFATKASGQAGKTAVGVDRRDKARQITS